LRHSCETPGRPAIRIEQSPNVKGPQGAGIALALLTPLLFAASDTAVRYLNGTVPLIAILAMRYATHLLVMGPFLAVSRRHGFATANPVFQIVRGLLLLGCSGLFLIALQHMPVAECTAVLMLTPVMVTLMAATLLKESVTLLRWGLVLGAFAGVLVIVRPGSGIFGWSALLPLGAALFFAMFQTLTSRYAAREDAYSTHFWTAAVGMAALLPIAALTHTSDPSGGLVDSLAALPARSLAVLLGIGLASTAGHLWLILAFERAPASVVSPLLYLQIAAALIFSGWLLGQWPDALGWFGMAIVAVCGASTARLNTGPKTPP
jgi:drug/metabolite transporter (DMT)-like permease